jgi:hypothetical protein
MQIPFFSKKKASKIINIPSNPREENFFLQGLGSYYQPVILDTTEREQQRKNYYTIPELNAIINYRAKCMSNGIWEVIENKPDGKVIVNHPLTILLNNPNPLQAKTEFIIALSINKDVFGNGYIYKYIITGFEKKLENIKALWVQPSEYLYPIPNTFNIYKTNTIEEIIKNFELWFQNKLASTYETKEIIQFSEPTIDYTNAKYIEGTSKQKPLSLPLSNIKAIYEAENVVISHKSPMAIISNEAKDAVGNLPMSANAVKAFNDDWKKRFGFKDYKNQYLLTDLAIKYTPITFPLKDLELGNTYERAISILCNAYEMPLPVFNYLQKSTSATSYLGQSIKQMYQDSIIPEMNNRCYEINRSFNLPNNGQVLRIRYDHLPIMQEDKKLKEESGKIENERLEKLWLSGIITRNDWRIELKKEPVNSPEFNKYIFELTDIPKQDINIVES